MSTNIVVPSGVDATPATSQPDAGEDAAVIDLRTALDVMAVPCAVPGSR